MLNADTESTLTATPDDVTDKNLFSYCDNNPVMRFDEGGDYWQKLALEGGLTLGTGALASGVSWSAFGTSILAGLGAITPVGWVILGVAAVAIGVSVYYAHNKGKAGRPELKKQGREGLEKKKGSGKYKGNPNKKPREQPRPHSPGDAHKKYLYGRYKMKMSREM